MLLRHLNNNYTVRIRLLSPTNSTNHNTQHNNLLSVYNNCYEDIETTITHSTQTTPSPISTPYPSPIASYSLSPSQ